MLEITDRQNVRRVLNPRYRGFPRIGESRRGGVPGGFKWGDKRDQKKRVPESNSN